MSNDENFFSIAITLVSVSDKVEFIEFDALTGTQLWGLTYSPGF